MSASASGEAPRTWMAFTRNPALPNRVSMPATTVSAIAAPRPPVAMTTTSASVSTPPAIIRIWLGVRPGRDPAAGAA